MEIQYEVIIKVWRDAASATLQHRNEDGEPEVLQSVESTDVNALVPALINVLRSHISACFEKQGADPRALERKEAAAKPVAESAEKTRKAEA